MSKMTTICIDGKALELALMRKGYSLQEADELTGKSPGYTSKGCRTGRIANASCIMFDKLLGIPVSEYELKETAVPVRETPEQAQIGAPALTFQDMAAAVEVGVKTALESFTDEYAIYKVGGVQTIRKRMEKEPEHEQSGEWKK